MPRIASWSPNDTGSILPIFVSMEEGGGQCNNLLYYVCSAFVGCKKLVLRVKTVNEIGVATGYYLLQLVADFPSQLPQIRLRLQ